MLHCCYLNSQIGFPRGFPLWGSHQVLVTSDSSALLSRVWRQRTVKPKTSQVTGVEEWLKLYILATLLIDGMHIFSAALARSYLRLLYCSSSQRNCSYHQTFTGVRIWTLFPKKQIHCGYESSKSINSVIYCNIKMTVIWIESYSTDFGFDVYHDDLNISASIPMLALRNVNDTIA